MDKFSHFKEAIRAYRPSDFQETSTSKPELLISGKSNNRVRTYYAPFDQINASARLILVGITPGRTQMNNALRSACQDLHAGLPDEEILRRAKLAGAYSGKMRMKLCELLDRWDIPQFLGAANASSLWDTHAHLVHFTSSLRDPVFLGSDENNYTGTNPSLHTFTAFEAAIHDLELELLSIPRGLIFPLGSSVRKLVELLVTQGRIPAERVLSLDGEVVEFPHPSGTNGERCKLALLDSLQTPDDYDQQMSKAYAEQKRLKGEILTVAQRQRYSKDRRRYLAVAEKTRKALRNLGALNEVAA